MSWAMSRVISCPRFPLASDLIWIIAFHSKKIFPLILFSSTLRPSPSLSEQFLILWPNFGSTWSRNFLKIISQRPFWNQVCTRVSRTRSLLHKSYLQTLALETSLALLREPYTLLLEQVNHTIESLLRIALSNHFLSLHWFICLVIPSITESPPIGESM